MYPDGEWNCKPSSHNDQSLRKFFSPFLQGRSAVNEFLQFVFEGYFHWIYNCRLADFVFNFSTPSASTVADKTAIVIVIFVPLQI